MKKLRITIENKTYDVTVEVLEDEDTPSSASSAPPRQSNSHVQTSTNFAAPAPQRNPASRQQAALGAITCPMAGVVLEVLVEVGANVEKGEPLIVLEAMKMENRVSATVAGTVKSVEVAKGDSVLEGHVLVVLE